MYDLFTFRGSISLKFLLHLNLNRCILKIIQFYLTVLGVDTISKRNFTGKSIPKYDNIVKSPMFDEDTKIFLPETAIQEAPFTGKNHI